MAITIEIAPELQVELARRAARRGVGLDGYAAGLLARAVDHPFASDKPESSRPPSEVVKTIERLKSFGKTHRLSPGGMTIREMRHEARP